MYLPALVMAAAGPVTPDHLCRVALAHKTGAVARLVGTGVSRHDAEYEVSHWYYLAWNGWPADKLPAAKRMGNWFLNNLHFAADAVDFREVPESGGHLWWFDRREPDWSADVLSAVYRRDTVFRQPAVGEKVAALLRESVGRKADPKSLHVEAVAWAPRILRDALESQRNGTYYDLLFGRQRFGADYREHADPKHAGYYTADRGRTWVGKDKIPKTDPNFPAKLDDWEGLFERRSKATATALGKPVDLAKLAVVAGYQEDTEKGSQVARAGRLVSVQQGDFGPVMETYDSQESVAGLDLLEFAPRFVRGERPKGTFGETLAALPAGGQAGGLWNAKGERVEAADPNIAKGPAPLNKAHAHAYHPAVLTMRSCVSCHALAYGLIEPRDQVRDAFDVRIDLKFADPADAIRFRGAFRGMRELVPGYQATYKSLVERTTKGPDGKPWAARELVMGVEGFVHDYDSPVTKDRAAAELGVTVATLDKVSAATLTARPKALLKGIACPRPTWDADVRPQLIDVLATEYPGGRGKP